MTDVLQERLADDVRRTLQALVPPNAVREFDAASGFAAIQTHVQSADMSEIVFVDGGPQHDEIVRRVVSAYNTVGCVPTLTGTAIACVFPPWFASNVNGIDVFTIIVG